MAEKNNIKIGKVINFSEYQNYAPVYRGLEAMGKGRADAFPMLPQIQPGTEEVTVNVSVTYEIK